MIPPRKNTLYKEALPPEIYEREPLLIGAAETDGKGQEKACGILALTDEEDFWDLSYIYVEKPCRRQGVGRGMLYLAEDILRASLSEGLYVTYLRRTDADLDAFFTACGFLKTEENKILCVTFMDIKDTGVLSRLAEPSAKICPLSVVSRGDFETLRQQIASDAAESETISDNVYLSLRNRRIYHNELSRVYYDKGGHPSGCVLCSERKQGLVIDYLYVKRSISPGNRMKAVMSMLFEVWNCANDELELGRRIFIHAANPEAERIFRLVAGDAVKDYGRYVEWVRR